jgi:hypothetical protein
MLKILTAVLLLGLAACAVPRDTTRVQWYPHVPAFWRTTPDGHKRDDGPFNSVLKGFTTDEAIDAGVDQGYARFRKLFPEFAAQVRDYPVALNDDYAEFIPTVQVWASGEETTGDKIIHLCLWSRGSAPTDPGSAFIVRPPGNYWGVDYTDWRFTAPPLCPALAHELLHTMIDDPGHKRTDMWARLNQ